MVCIDLTPGSTSQVKPHKDILQVGGWSDSVYDVIASFIEYGDSQDHWVNEIEKVTVGWVWVLLIEFYEQNIIAS